MVLDSCWDAVDHAPHGQEMAVRASLPCETCPHLGECLTGRMAEMGSLLYGREMLTQIKLDEHAILSRSEFAPWLLQGETLTRHWRPPVSQEERWRIVQAWDLAWSEKTGGDWLVFMCALVDMRTGVRRLLDIERWQGLPFVTADESSLSQVGLIEAKWRQWDADVVCLEADAAQVVWRQTVQAFTPVPVLQHKAGGSDTDASKRDLRDGVPGMLIRLQSGRWRFPWTPGAYHHEEVENFLDECEAFQFVDGKLQGVGEHDDTVMCWWHLNWVAEKVVANFPKLVEQVRAAQRRRGGGGVVDGATP